MTLVPLAVESPKIKVIQNWNKLFYNNFGNKILWGQSKRSGHMKVVQFNCSNISDLIWTTNNKFKKKSVSKTVCTDLLLLKNIVHNTSEHILKQNAINAMKLHSFECHYWLF